MFTPNTLTSCSMINRIQLLYFGSILMIASSLLSCQENATVQLAELTGDWYHTEGELSSYLEIKADSSFQIISDAGAPLINLFVREIRRDSIALQARVPKAQTEDEGFQVALRSYGSYQDMTIGFILDQGRLLLSEGEKSFTFSRCKTRMCKDEIPNYFFAGNHVVQLNLDTINQEVVGSSVALTAEPGTVFIGKPKPEFTGFLPADDFLISTGSPKGIELSEFPFELERLKYEKGAEQIYFLIDRQTDCEILRSIASALKNYLKYQPSPIVIFSSPNGEELGVKWEDLPQLSSRTWYRSCEID